MSYDTRRMGGGDFVPPIEERTSQRPQSRPAPQRGDYRVQTETATAAVEAAQGEPPERPAFNPFTVKLSRPYKAYDDDIHEVTFREPKPADVMQIGYPMRHILDPATGQMMALEILPDKGARYVVALSNPPIPMSTVQAMDFGDFDKCLGAVCSFFVG